MVLKIQPQTFKSSYIKLIALLYNLVFSLIFFINLQIPVNTRNAHISSSTAFGLFGIAHLITSIIYIVIRNARKDCKCLKVIWLVDIAYLIAGQMYYLGKNFPLIAEAFSHQISCFTPCQKSILSSQPILLGMGVMFYRFIPLFISKYYQSNLAKEHQTTEAKLQLVPEWILAAESLTLLVEFDSLYIVIIRSFIQSPETVCTPSTMAVAWVLWALFVLLYTVVVYYTMNVQYRRNCNANISCLASNLGTIVALAAFGMYLLANEYIPLVCATGINVPIVWIVMKVLVLIVVITAIVLLLAYRCQSKTRQEKLLPRALYQHLHHEPDEQVYELNTQQLESSINGNKDKKEYKFTN